MDIFNRGINRIDTMLFGARSPRSRKTSVSDDHSSGIDSDNTDLIVQTKGIAGYRKMRRDAEVSADTDIRLAAMIPGLQLLPADTDEDAKASCGFVESVLMTMRGDLLHTIRDQMCDEAVVTGFFVGEPKQKIIELPDYGKVLGLDSIQVRPSEGFSDNIELNEAGDIINLHQSTLKGDKDITLDDVLYYAFRGQPWNPYGRSIYYGAYDYWVLKRELMRLFADFTTVNASGIKEYSIEDKDFQKDKASALDRLVKMAGRASLVRKKSHELKIHIPPGTAGYNFIRGIKELCNVEIRKAILYDELINAEGVRTGSRSAREVSENVMYSVMATQGQAFCTAIAEQLFRRILDWNGFERWPIPRLVPEATPKRDADPAPILQAVTAAYTAGVFTDIPNDVREQMLRQALRPMGVDYIEDAPEVGDRKDETKAKEMIYFVNAPAGRTHADLMRMKREAIIAEKSGQAELTNVWKANLPNLKKKLNSALFDASGHWKSKNYGSIRKAIEENISAGGTGIRKTLTDMLVDRYDKGTTDAENMIPIKAAVTVTPVMITPTAAREMLRQRVHMTMGRTYSGMTDDIYYILERAINGGISERAAMAEVNEYLAGHGFTPGRATTIVNTSLSQAYNQGRMEIFNQLSDPDGVTPGGIIGYMYSAVMDDATTDICQEYDGLNFRVDDPSLPTELLHYDCRRVLLPIFSGEEPWSGKGWTSQNDSKILYDRTADMSGSFRKAS